MNIHLLRQTVRRRGGVRYLAESLGWHRKKVQELMRGDFEPSRKQMVNLARGMELGQWEFVEIFFPELLDERGRYWDAFHQMPEKEPKKQRKQQKEKFRDRIRYRLRRIRLWFKQAFWGIAARFERLFRR